ncbi:Ribosomal protein S18 acetylase RimI [Peptostreptococcaceae bacterium pGA-8]|nr:Ribosomal protein S18 acetylase RimI [Peptostreptococcaceae bacterium pGA-8]
MEIRYITSFDDRNLISKIYEDSWRHAYRGIISQEYLDKIPKGHWSKAFDISDWNTVVCIHDGKYIGTSSFCKSRFEKYNDLGEVISIYLLPEYMGLGYGKQLLDFVVEQLKEQGYTEAFLWVLEENERARNFYEKYGFKLDNDYLEDTIAGKELREVRYTLKLI